MNIIKIIKKEIILSFTKKKKKKKFTSGIIPLIKNKTTSLEEKMNKFPTLLISETFNLVKEF